MKQGQFAILFFQCQEQSRLVCDNPLSTPGATVSHILTVFSPRPFSLRNKCCYPSSLTRSASVSFLKNASCTGKATNPTSSDRFRHIYKLLHPFTFIFYTACSVRVVMAHVR